MLLGTDRLELRKVFRDAWQKHLARAQTEPLEQLVVDVVRLHPEYHRILEGPTENLERDYLPELGETNPYLHMAMHIAIREQLATQRPPGIADVYRELLAGLGDPHQVEHEMMECLAHGLWQAQREGRPPDERAYLECLRKRANH